MTAVGAPRRRLRRAHPRALLGMALLLVCSVTLPAEQPTANGRTSAGPIGRVFFTPAERAAMAVSAARSAGAAASPAPGEQEHDASAARVILRTARIGQTVHVAGGLVEAVPAGSIVRH